MPTARFPAFITEEALEMHPPCWLDLVLTTFKCFFFQTFPFTSPRPQTNQSKALRLKTFPNVWCDTSRIFWRIAAYSSEHAITRGSGSETEPKQTCMTAGVWQVDGQALSLYLYADGVVCLLFFFFFPYRSGRPVLLQLPLMKTKPPEVWWQAAISRSAVFVPAENLGCRFCWQCVPLLKCKDCCI